MIRRWPLLLLALPAFVATWSGWVGLGRMVGFGVVEPLPGILDGFTINTAVTLPIGIEVYAAYAMSAWLTSRPVDAGARSFAKWSALGALVLGAGGQVAYHLLEVAGVSSAPWQVVTAVSCLPVVVLGMGAALGHLLGRAVEPASKRSPVPVGTTAIEGKPVEVFDWVEQVPEFTMPDDLLKRAVGAFLPSVMAGDVPSIRDLKAALNVGQPRAEAVRRYLTTIAAS